MYTIELDVDPVTLGFDPKEITRKEDGTYIVTRRFVHIRHYHDAESYYSIEAYCPCLTDNVEIYCYVLGGPYRRRETYGANYVTNDGEQCTNDRSSLNNSMMNYWYPLGPGRFNRQYDTHIEDRLQEEAAALCVSTINGHPNNIDSSLQRDYYEKYHIVFGKGAPSNPYEDPFLPEKFRQMLNAANSGNKA